MSMITVKRRQPTVGAAWLADRAATLGIAAAVTDPAPARPVRGGTTRPGRRASAQGETHCAECAQRGIVTRRELIAHANELAKRLDLRVVIDDDAGNVAPNREFMSDACRRALPNGAVRLGAMDGHDTLQSRILHSSAGAVFPSSLVISKSNGPPASIVTSSAAATDPDANMVSWGSLLTAVDMASQHNPVDSLTSAATSGSDLVVDLSSLLADGTLCLGWIWRIAQTREEAIERTIKVEMAGMNTKFTNLASAVALDRAETISKPGEATSVVGIAWTGLSRAVNPKGRFVPADEYDVAVTLTARSASSTDINFEAMPLVGNGAATTFALIATLIAAS